MKMMAVVSACLTLCVLAPTQAGEKPKLFYKDIIPEHKLTEVRGILVFVTFSLGFNDLSYHRLKK